MKSQRKLGEISLIKKEKEEKESEKKKERQLWESNPGSSVYETDALPLC